MTEKSPATYHVAIPNAFLRARIKNNIPFFHSNDQLKANGIHSNSFPHRLNVSSPSPRLSTQSKKKFQNQSQNEYAQLRSTPLIPAHTLSGRNDGRSGTQPARDRRKLPFCLRIVSLIPGSRRRGRAKSYPNKQKIRLARSRPSRGVPE